MRIRRPCAASTENDGPCAMLEKPASKGNYANPRTSDWEITWQGDPEYRGDNVGVEAMASSASLTKGQLSEQIRQAMRATGYLPLRNLDICAAEGLITIKGRVPSY